MTRRRPSRRLLAVVGLVVACLVAGAAAFAVRTSQQDDPGSSATAVVRTQEPDPDWELVQGDSGEQGWVRVEVLAAARPPGEGDQVRLGVYTVDLRAAPDDRAETVGTLTLHY